MTIEKKRKQELLATIPQAGEPPWEYERPRTPKARREERQRARKQLRASRSTMPVIVYLVRAENGLIKIGCAFDIVLRLVQLQAMSPVKLELLAYVDGEQAAKFERALHRHFDGDRSHGEWFRINFEQVCYAVDLATERGWRVQLHRWEHSV
jgi:hypothetical protein